MRKAVQIATLTFMLVALLRLVWIIEFGDMVLVYDKAFYPGFSGTMGSAHAISFVVFARCELKVISPMGRERVLVDSLTYSRINPPALYDRAHR